jgi:phosphate starvation-inducible protein PhoH
MEEVITKIKEDESYILRGDPLQLDFPAVVSQPLILFFRLLFILTKNN